MLHGLHGEGVLRKWFGVLALVQLAGCGGTEFASVTPQRASKIENPVTSTGQGGEQGFSLGMSCSSGAAPITREEKVGTAPVHLTLEGELCPVGLGQTTVLFITDFSGSMGVHLDANSNTKQPGNDPSVNGSCGRFAAIQAVMSSLAQSGATAEMKLAFLPFAGDVVAGAGVTPRSFADFSAQVTAATVCRYVVQDGRFGYHPFNPGGISGGSVSSSTNYAAAFAEAKRWIASTPGRKVVYFISDGMPTSGGADPLSAGVAAAKSLVAGSDVVLNALLLGTEASQARASLAAVTGDQARVRLAQDASALVTEIMSFPTLELNMSSAKAQLQMDGSSSAITLSSFTRDAANPGKYLFKTSPILLQGNAGEEKQLNLTINALSSEGASYQTQGLFKFKRL